MRAVYELVVGIAKYLSAEGKNCTFDALAKMINDVSSTGTYSGGRGTAKVVSEAYKCAWEKYGPEVAEMIARVFTNKNGGKAY